MSKRYQVEQTSRRSGKNTVAGEFNTLKAAIEFFDWCEAKDNEKRRSQFYYCVRDNSNGLIIHLVTAF